jgi:alcohol dehydrogenase class IV
MKFSILQPQRVLFGRGEASKAATLVRAFGTRGIVVHGATAARASFVLSAGGLDVQALSCPSEPTLDMLEAAVAQSRPFRPEWVMAIGGGAVLDLGKALAAMIPATGGVLDHLEGVGKALPLRADPLPFIAVPTTAGTGAEVTKNAVIGVPEHGRKVSLRDEQMMARLAIVDPALTDHCPWPVTLASGLDAVTQVIEPYVSCKANPYTDAIAFPVIAPGLRALMRLRTGEDAAARDALAWTSLCGGMALANAGLGAVHGLAGVIGGMTGAAHGAICGALLGPVVAMNRSRSTGAARDRLDRVCVVLAEVLGSSADDAPMALDRWVREAGLHGLTALGLDADAQRRIAVVSRDASSMKGNPVPLGVPDLEAILSTACA